MTASEVLFKRRVAAGCCQQHDQATCSQMAACSWSDTEDECMQQNDNGCDCLASNGQSQFDCPDWKVTGWQSGGKKCVRAHPDEYEDWTKHPNGWAYPADYGVGCKKHPEPGSYHCTNTGLNAPTDDHVNERFQTVTPYNKK